MPDHSGAPSFHSSPEHPVPGIGAIAAALSRVQGDLKVAIKDKANPFFKSKYADLQTVWDTARSLLAREGLAVLQLPGGDSDLVRVTTMIVHTSGQWIADDGLAMKPVKSDPQGVASCITYARRYGLMAVLGIVSDEDDDGEAATGRGSGAREIPEPAPKAGLAARVAMGMRPLPPVSKAEAAKPATKTTEATLDAVPLLAALTALKVSGGWNAPSHKQNWKEKHKGEFEKLSPEDRAEVNKAFLAVPMAKKQDDDSIPF